MPAHAWLMSQTSMLLKLRGLVRHRNGENVGRLGSYFPAMSVRCHTILLALVGAVTQPTSITHWINGPLARVDYRQRQGTGSLLPELPTKMLKNTRILWCYRAGCVSNHPQPPKGRTIADENRNEPGWGGCQQQNRQEYVFENCDTGAGRAFLERSAR